MTIEWGVAGAHIPCDRHFACKVSLDSGKWKWFRQRFVINLLQNDMPVVIRYFEVLLLKDKGPSQLGI